MGGQDKKKDPTLGLDFLGAVNKDINNATPEKALLIFGVAVLGALLIVLWKINSSSDISDTKYVASLCSVGFVVLCIPSFYLVTLQRRKELVELQAIHARVYAERGRKRKSPPASRTPRAEVDSQAGIE